MVFFVSIGTFVRRQFKYRNSTVCRFYGQVHVYILNVVVPYDTTHPDTILHIPGICIFIYEIEQRACVRACFFSPSSSTTGLQHKVWFVHGELSVTTKWDNCVKDLMSGPSKEMFVGKSRSSIVAHFDHLLKEHRKGNSDASVRANSVGGDADAAAAAAVGGADVEADKATKDDLVRITAVGTLFCSPSIDERMNKN